jgi:hypothetical protein
MSPAEFAAQGSEPVASRAGRIELGGEVSANRLGFGAMRLPGVWETHRRIPGGRAASSAG